MKLKMQTLCVEMLLRLPAVFKPEQTRGGQTRGLLGGHDVRPLSGSVMSLPVKTGVGEVGGALTAGLPEAAAAAAGGGGAGTGAGGKMAPV